MTTAYCANHLEYSVNGVTWTAVGGGTGWDDFLLVPWLRIRGAPDGGSGFQAIPSFNTTQVARSALDALSCQDILIRRSDMLGLIDRLGSGGGMTQEQLDAILAKMDQVGSQVSTTISSSASSGAASVVSRVDVAEGVSVVGVILVCLLFGVFFGWKALGRGAGRSG